MNGWSAEVVAVVLLTLCLGGAVIRPRGINEAVIALPAAAIVVASGIVSFDDARPIVHQLASTVGFLAAILVFGHLCADAGVFDYLGARAGRASRGDPRRLLALIVAVAAVVTATLTLDAAVVLLTPVVIRTAQQLRVPARPHAYACVEVANAGSLLLPVSNLTNLLAFSAADVSFGQFTALMALPWLAATVLQWVGLRTFFGADLPEHSAGTPESIAAPRYALVVLVLTVAGFVMTSALSVAPAWAAVAGCVLLGAPALRRRQLSLRHVIESANIGFCAFVFALGIIVDGVSRHGLADGLSHLVPSGSSLWALLAVALLAAVLANIVNNLPATLLLLPLVSAQPAAVLAVLIGVNIGPNATYAGSLANLLWRRILPASEPARAREFHRYAALTVVPSLVVGTALLWLGVHLIGT